MIIRPAQTTDELALIGLITEFRAALSSLRGNDKRMSPDQAKSELDEYCQKGFPIFTAEETGEIIGYLVCRVEDEVVWAESLFVQPQFRRRGVAGLLYAEAEKLAQALGGDAPYNWVDPNNNAIIQFLRKRGYDVLNLIELRRPYEGEHLTRVIKVGDQTFYSHGEVE